MAEPPQGPMQNAPEPGGNPPGLIQRLGLNRPGRAMIAVGASLVVVVVLYMVLTGGRSDEPTVVLPSASAAASAAATQGERAQVPPVDACELVTQAELEVALGIANLDFVDRGIMSTSGRDSCTWRNIRDAGPIEGLAVGIGPGSPDDFEPDASLGGMAGTTVEGAGDAAVWFSGDGFGTISVATTNSYGYVFLRVAIQRPDTDDAGRQRAAAELAVAAIHRMPGAEVEPLESVIIEPEPPDRVDDSVEDNLLAREESGDWTLGEGLVATLGLITGDANATGVLLHPALQPDGQEATGLVALADQYLAIGEDPAAQEEISALLGHFVFTDEQLEEMAGVAPETSAITLAAARPATSLGGAVAQNPTACKDFFYKYDLEAVVSGDCLQVDEFGVGSGTNDKYRIYRPAPDAPQGGWDDSYVKLVRQAVTDAVPVYEQFGLMPRVNLVLTVVAGGKNAMATADPGGGRPCSVAIFTASQHISSEPFLQDRYFKQAVAHELAHCLTSNVHTPQSRIDWKVRKWWYEGSAEYLSNLVYTSVNWEHRFSPHLAKIELGTSLVARDYENFAFFQHFANEESPGLVLDLIGRMPGCGSASIQLSDQEQIECWGRGIDEQARKLTSYPKVDEIYHSYAENLTDARVEDTGGGRIEYDPPTKVIDAKGSYQLKLDAFEVVRVDLQVPEGETACLDHDPQGDIIVSWRVGTADGDGLPRLYGRDLPDTVDRQAVFIATAIRDGAVYTLDVKDFVDKASDCNPDEPQSIDCSICGYSDFYWLENNLDEFVRRLLPPLSEPTEINE
jgi:hypothetical protein